MGDDRSLDEFLGTSETDSAADADTDAEPSGDERDENESRDDSTVTGNEVTDDSIVTDDAATAVDGDDACVDEAETEAEAVEPAVATFRWSSTGVACAVCDDVVQRQWYDDESEDYVCLDCKPW